MRIVGVRKGVLAVVGSLALGAAGYALADTQSVSLNSHGPDPATVTVAWGDTLEIENDDSVGHGLTSRYPELKVDAIPAGQTYTTTFTNRTITYGYRQTGAKRYPGVVIVKFSGHVSLGARPVAVARGHAVRLKGVASRHHTAVLLELRAGGGTSWTRLKVVSSGSGGGFAATVRLQRGGKVRASIEAGRIRSGTVTVDVKPAISVSARGGRIHARVTPARRGLAAHPPVPHEGTLARALIPRDGRDRERLVPGARRHRPGQRPPTPPRGRLRAVQQPGSRQRRLLDQRPAAHRR